ncbi:MAG: TauD/TfdA family dioxygenase [Pseudomonadota bacterium]|nr:TauD/TfdA family dioxygenase [Pseudomonadota bacterium]
MSDLTVQPMTGAGGAEISGVDLAKPLGEKTFAAIRKAFDDYLVLVFRDQTLSPDAFESLVQKFAPLQPHPFVKPVDGHPCMIMIERKADEAQEVKIVGEDWHADAPWLENPVAGSSLYCLEAPPYGGDTNFCNLMIAYDSLSEGVKKTIEPLILVSRAASGADYLKSQQGNKSMSYDLSTDIHKECEHPLVQIHPRTGRKVLAVTGPYGYKFKGWTEKESKPLMDMLLAHATRSEHTFRVRWKKGSLGVWDNRCTLHQAIKDYPGFARRMLRLQFKGVRPMGHAMPETMVAAPL